MQIHITGRQVEITPAIRKFTEERLKKLDKLLGGTTEAHVVLAVEKRRHHAEIQVKSRTALLSGQTETGDLFASIGGVATKLERQALKHKEKRTIGKRRAGRKVVPAVLVPELPSPPKKLTGRAATPKRLRIRTSDRYRMRPLSAEEAALELDSNGGEVLVYRDAKTFRVNVIFRRRDGEFGLVDPEF
jgi:putative sigma-54 modulation protein